MLSDLPRDVAEDVLSRLPVTSLRGVRFTSKKWNRISKKRSFKKKHIASAAAEAPEKEFMAVMMVDYWIHLMSFNLHGCVDQSVSSQGYENTNSCGRIHKVLRFYRTSQFERHIHIRYELYYLNSMDTTTTFPVTVLPDWETECYANGVSVKGNTYWYAKQNLGCFDFTSERFGPRLRLPFHSYSLKDTITLSSVRDEQLAVLFQKDQVWNMEIWITTKIETQELSWSIFLRVDSFGCRFAVVGSSFFVDEEKKVAMVIENDACRCVACIFGEDAYFRKVDLGISAKAWPNPLLCPYVPSSVHLHQSAK